MTRREMKKTCYSKKYNRKFTIRKLARWPIEWLLHKISEYHISDNKKQVAVFAFDHIAHSINIQGIYEKEELDVFFDWMSKLNVSFTDKLAIDIGANIGNHSLYFADYFESVHSFEPNPRTFDVLSINSNLVGNIICHKIGLSDVARNSQIKTNVGNIGNSVVVDGADNGTVGISLETLDSFNLKKVGLIKIDVEGHEYKALLGAKTTISQNQPIILFEQHLNDFVGNSSPVVELIKSFGYSRFAVIQRGPNLNRGVIAASLINVILRLLIGERININIVESFSPGFYNFVIAIPNCMVIKEQEPIA